MTPGRGACAAAALVLACGFGVSAGAELRAEQITADTADRLRIDGPDAIGGVGDWWLANDVVEVVVDDVGRQHGLLTHGGTIVDVGLRDRSGEDQFARLVPLVNLSQRVVVGYDAIRAEVDAQGRFARLVVTSPGLDAIPRGGFWARALDVLVPDAEEIASVRVETVYEVRPGESSVWITTTLTNAGDAAAPVFAFGDLWMRGGRGGRGFLGDALHLERSRGFAARDMTPDARRSLDALASFSHAGLLGTADFPPIAYALDAPGRSARGQSLFGMLGEHASLVLGLVGDPDIGELGLLALARSLFRDLGPGQAWTWRRRLRVAGRREVAALAEPIFRELGLAVGELRGSVALGGRRGAVHVETPGGALVTQLALAGASGPQSFSARLPAGEFVAVLRAEHAAPQRIPFRVAPDEPGAVAFEPLPEPARLVFGRAFADGGPGRIELRGLGGTPDPVFGDDLLGASLGGAPLPSATASSALLFVGGEREPTEVPIAPGRYRLVATRGLDWEAASRELVVPEAGSRTAVPPFELAPLEALPGFVRADLHVHAQASHDAQVPNEERLRRFVAEGVGVLVATDHDRVAHYAPALARLGVADRVRVVAGVEVTTSAPSRAAPWTIGHHNAWPVPHLPHAHRRGAPASQNRSVGTLYAELRHRYGARVVQLNHPRPSPRDLANDDLDMGFFAHQGEGVGFDPARPLTAAGNAPLLRSDGPDDTRALDFDALEVMNGSSYAQYLATRADWYALLRQGVRRTATANSDSHAPGELAAYPRNYVWVGPEGDAPQRFDAALRAGRSFGTTGPRVRRLRVGVPAGDGLRGAGSPGDLVSAREGGVRVEYAVDGARWVPIDEVRVLVNGAVVQRGAARSGQLDLQLERDAFVTLEAGAPLDADPAAWIRDHPGLYTEVIAPGFVSTALANPVFVDVDGNGRFDAPGL